MPKTSKPFNWEIYDETGEFVDILSMTRSEMTNYKQTHQGYSVKEIGYIDDGGDDSWKTDRQERRDIYRVRIPKGHRRSEDVY